MVRTWVISSTLCPLLEWMSNKSSSLVETLHSQHEKEMKQG